MNLWLYPTLPWDNIHEIRIDHFPFVIGRRSDSDCALPFAFVSRHHCKFTLHDSQVMVQDLESHNGTLVNGKPAGIPVPINHGDEISLGPVSFRVVILSAPQETPEGYRGVTEEPALGVARQETPHGVARDGI